VNGYEELYEEAEQELKQLVCILPSKMSRESVSKTSKSALKAHVIRAGLLHRSVDLAAAAIDLYKKSKNLPAFVLTRAALETYALFYYFIKKIEEAISSGKVQEVDEILMRLMLGARDSDDDVKAVNILTAIDRLDKDAKDTRRMYDGLCEMAHPNWMGTVGHYGKTEESPYTLYFESPYEGFPIEAGLGLISAILGDLIEMNESVQDTLSRFTIMHEKGEIL
jgi:hypothetical protein